MKNLIIIILLTMLCSSLQAQQNPPSYITNPYIQSSNLLSTVTTLNNYRASVDLRVYPDDEILDNSAYYKFSYQPIGGSAAAWGVIDIRCTKNNLKTNPIETVTDFYYDIFAVDYDEDDYTKEFIKTTNVHAGYFFNKNLNQMYIIMLSQPNKDFVLRL